MNRVPFAPGEWYHCFSRGIDKRETFTHTIDYKRFLGLLYVTNSTPAIHRSDMRSAALADVLSASRGKPLVDIGAFCLMPNHFHLLLREISQGGISSFMRKLGTAYTMYFNIRHDRTGNLFTKPFRSKHVSDDRYLQRVLQYIHCNPAETFEAGWKEGRVANMALLQKKLMTYPYSSFRAFSDENTPARKILSDAIFEIETKLPPAKMLREAREYYRDINVKVTP